MISTAIGIPIFGLLICLFAWSGPVSGAKPPPPSPTDRYIAEHPAQFSILEVHAAIERVKERQQ